jgi:hypothetical protein
MLWVSSSLLEAYSPASNSCSLTAFRQRGSVFPSRALEIRSRWVRRVAATTPPLVQFTGPSEYCRPAGIALSGWRRLHGLGPCGRASEAFPRPDGRASILRRSPYPPVDLVLLQSMARTEPSLAGLALLGFVAPTAHEVAGSDPHRGCLPRLCCVSRLSRPPDALFLPRPFRLCFAPVTLVGFPLQRIPLPRRRFASRRPCPSRRPSRATGDPAGAFDRWSCNSPRRSRERRGIVCRQSNISSSGG